MPRINIRCEYCKTLVPKGRYTQHAETCRKVEQVYEDTKAEMHARFVSDVLRWLTSSPSPNAPVHPVDSEAGPHVHSEHQTTRIRDALPS